MTIPQGGSVKVEITGDVHEFASNAEAQIKASMSTISEDVTRTLGDQGAIFQRDGQTAGRSFGEGARAGVRSGGAGIGEAARGEAATAGREAGSSFHEYGERAGERFTEGTREGLKSLHSAVLGGIGAMGIGEILERGLDQADSLEGANIAIEHMFGESGKAVQAWGKTLATTYGLSAAQAEQAAAAYGGILRPLGLGGDEASKMSEKLVTLAADTAQALNADPSKVQAAFTSGLRGRSTALRQYGIDISATQVQQEAMRLGLVKVGEKMTDQAKTEASYHLMLQDTAKYEGAVGDSSETLAVQKRKLEAEVHNLEAGLGLALFPALSKVANVMLVDVVPALKDVGTWIKNNREWLEPLAIMIGGAVIAYKAVAIATGLWESATAGVTAVLRIFTPAMEEADEAMEANPIGLIVAALAALAIGLVYAWNHFKTFRDVVTDAWKDVKDVASALAHFFSVTIPAAFEAMLSGAKRVWKDVIAQLRHWGSDAGSALHTLTEVPASIYHKFQQIVGWLRSVWSNVTRDIRSLITSVVSLIGSIPSRLNGVARNIGAWFRNLGVTMWNGLVYGLEGLANIGRDLYNAVAGSINEYLIDPIRSWHFTVGAFGVSHTFEPFGGIPDIPMWAHGGELEPGWNIVGDRGIEALYNDPSSGRSQVYSNASAAHFMGGAGGSGSLMRLHPDDLNALLAAVASRPDTLVAIDGKVAARAINTANAKLGRLR